MDGVLSGRALRKAIGSKADVVAALVTYHDLSEEVQQYAPYSLRVNGVVQPGGQPTGVTCERERLRPLPLSVCCSAAGPEIVAAYKPTPGGSRSATLAVHPAVASSDGFRACATYPRDPTSKLQSQSS